MTGEWNGWMDWHHEAAEALADEAAAEAEQELIDAGKIADHGTLPSPFRVYRPRRRASGEEEPVTGDENDNYCCDWCISQGHPYGVPEDEYPGF